MTKLLYKYLEYKIMKIKNLKPNEKQRRNYHQRIRIKKENKMQGEKKDGKKMKRQKQHAHIHTVKE